MKNGLTFLLLLITLAGTFFPCCLVDRCSDEEITNTSNENKRQPEGNCSPFFACASCPGSVEPTKPIHFEIPIAEKIVYQQVIIKFNLPTYSSSFFQPPRSC